MREAVIIDAIRTPIGRRNGSLSQIHPVNLLGKLLKGFLEKNQIDDSLIDDVIIGCVSQTGEQAANIARNAWLSANLAEEVPGTTIDRQCGSSLQALQFAAEGIMAGSHDLVIAGGVESMSRVPIGSASIEGQTIVTKDLQERYNLSKYGFNQYIGAEMIAQEVGITRRDMDEYSLESHRRAHEAQEKGYFEKEIFPVEIEDLEGNSHLFQEDETIRPDSTLNQLLNLQPPFPFLTNITAANSSQISDGASLVLIASREKAEALGLKPRASFKAFSVVGSDPVTMLKGPIPATKKVLERAQLTMDDIDLVEINEAFASVVLRWNHDIQVSLDKVNVNGGAIALGHPLGATGTRLVTSLVHELERRDGQYGLITICEGGGMANAMIIERINN